MKKFIVTIIGHTIITQNLKCHLNDDPISLEQAIVDKLGVNDIKWEYVGANVYDFRQI